MISAPSITFWGIALPSLVLTSLIKFWYLHMVSGGAVSVLVLAESMRKTVAMLAIASCLMMISSLFVRNRRTLVAHLLLAQALAFGMALAEGSGALFSAETGAVLDLYVLRAGMATNIVRLLGASVPSQFQLLMLVDLFVCAAGPWYLVLRGAPSRFPRLAPRGWLLAAAAGLGAALAPSALTGSDGRIALTQSTTLEFISQAPGFVQATSHGRAEYENQHSGAISPAEGQPRRNIVFILLESTRRDAMSLYEPGRKTTPTLDKLANELWIFDRTYVPMPATSKALVSTFCGIYPNPTVLLTEAVPGSIPARCLPHLLRDVGYESLFLHPAPGADQLFRTTIKNIGFDGSKHLEDLETDGFRRVNYMGYEEATMLAPSEAWVARKKESGTPFLLTYLSMSTHYEYAVPPEEIGSHAPPGDFNRYLSGMRLTDAFLGDVIEMLRRQGVWDNTVLVVMGDHGEAFGEHQLTGHNGVLHEEVLHIPLAIRAPGGAVGRVGHLTSQLDMLPTLVRLSGHKLDAGEYVGRDLADPGESRILYSACVYDHQCAALIAWPMKYIYNYGHRGDELYDIAADPRENHNLAAERQDMVKRYRSKIRTWYRETRANYGAPVD